jgi:ribose-phosphate pyrophosphokinase
MLPESRFGVQLRERTSLKNIDIPINSMPSPYLLFSTSAYSYLQHELALLSGWEEGQIHYRLFPDGEQYHRIVSDLNDRDIILIGGTIDDQNTMELYDLAQGMAHGAARSLRIVIPYFGYGTMERAIEPGEIVKAKNRALLFSSIPMCDEANRVILMDLHSEGIPYYFDRDIRTSHIYCKEVIMDAARLLAGGTDFVLAATDAGRAKWVESLANEMQVKSAFVYKHRLSGDTTEITGVNASVNDKTVIIYDDMIRTGGSLMQAAKAYKAHGASSVFAITTHGLFTNQALDKIHAQGIIQSIIATNTHPLSLQTHPLLQVKSIAPLIVHALS